MGLRSGIGTANERLSKEDEMPNSDQPFAREGYVRITKHPIGYLINFGPIGKLQYKRFILSEFV